MTTKMIDDLTRQLDDLEFVRDPATGCYDHGPTRIVIDDPAAGDVTVYRFTANAAHLLVWKASFSGASADVVVATIRAAVDPNH